MCPSRRRLLRFACLSALVVGSGCQPADAPLPPSSSVELRIGLGLGGGEVSGTADQIVQNVSTEGLVSFSRDGRYQPWLAQSLELRDNGLTWRVTLRDGVRFHDGTLVDAETVKTILVGQFRQLGAAFDVVRDVLVSAPNQIDINLDEPSTLIAEGLSAAAISRPGTSVSVGPFMRVASTDGRRTILQRNDAYYGGSPTIERILIQPYSSVRAAWADLLRGEVDMLYEVGGDALDSLEPSSSTRIYTFSRPYAYVAILNTHRPSMKSPEIRRALNSAIDRQRFVTEGLNGHGHVATGPVSPFHWANPSGTVASRFAPERLSKPLTLHCLYFDQTDERLALVVKRMLEDIGASVTLELVSQQTAFDRMRAGDFDVVLGDLIQGPGLLRPMLFWGTGEPLNWAHYANAKVDAAFKAIRGASNDDQYKAAVTALQSAMVDDPPAIFLAWRERARAVSTRFDVPVEPGRDILRTLRLWTPTGSATSTN
jgi:ABC-type transport system substrate-binding protein